MSQTRKEFKAADLTGDIQVLITTGDFILQSTLKDLPTDLLEKVAEEAGVLLLERDEDWNSYASIDTSFEDDYLDTSEDLLDDQE